MKIVKLILNNYKRVFLNNITHIEYTPKDTTQIILGQNGSGKSSLLEQLTPLAANVKKDFNDDGYKEITIEHNNQLYVLKNGRTTKHSFLLDGEELNNGGTVSVQNTLVEYHFGITPHIQQVLLGKTMFTTMSPTERKRWITEISTLDYSYAITVYNSLKQRHRDIVGGIKLLQNNIVRVEQGSLPSELIDSLASDKTHIANTIDHLLTLISQSTTTDDLDTRITRIGSMVNSISLRKNTVATKSIDELTTLVNTYKGERNTLTTLTTKIYHELSDIEQSITVEDKELLTTKITELDNKINVIVTSNIFKDINNVELLSEYLDNNYGEIVGLLSTLTEHMNLDVSKQRTDELQSAIITNEVELGRLDKHVHKLEERLEHLEHHLKASKEITCPKCTHHWTPSYTDDEYTGYQKELSVYNNKRIAIRKVITNITTELGNVESVLYIVTTFVKYLSRDNDSKILLNYIKCHNDYLVNGYSSLFSLFEVVCNEVNRLNMITPLLKERSAVADKLKEVVTKSKLEEGFINETKAKLNASVLVNRSRITELDNSIRELESSISVKNKYNTNLNTLATELKGVYSTKQLVIETKRNTLLKIAIKELRLTLLDIDEKLTSHIEYETKLRTYQLELDELNTRERLLKITLKELSPSEGLIAKSISSFLNYFISDMNSIIASIWGYDMEILGCDLADNDLDYKFKVLVNNDEIIEDISKTSSSMQEIINLVFKVTFAKYKGFIGYPLILDEFGRTFDSNHRITAYEALDRSIANDFSQVFMVSHFESMYGRFGNADISILGTTGVDMASITKYNDIMFIS